MFRLLISSVRNSPSKLCYGSLSVSNRLLLKPVTQKFICCTTNHNITQAAIQVRPNYVEEKIEKLDQNVRKAGRCSMRDIRSIMSEAQTTGYLSPTQALMLIRSCGSLLVEEKPVMRNILVQEVWKLIRNLNVPIDISHYNALLRVYLENEFFFVPSTILAEIQSAGLEPNRVTCQRLAARNCQMGDLDGATKVLEYMREKGMSINEVIFNSLIQCHAQKNDMESAENILKVMKEGGIEPSSNSYTNLLCGYIKNKNLDKFSTRLNELESNETFMQENNYFSIILALADNGFEEEIDNILANMKKSSSYNHEATNFCIQLIINDKAEIAFKLLKTMVKITRSDGTVVPIGNFFMSQLVRANCPADTLLKYSNELMSKNLNPVALSVTMEICLRQQKVDQALELFRAGKELNIPIRHHYFWPLLISRGEKKDIEGMMDILSVMKNEFNLQPNIETVQHYILPHMLSSSNDVSKILFDLKNVGIPYGVSAGNIVCTLLGNNKMRKAADLTKTYPTSYALHNLRILLNKCFLKTKDVDSYVTILKDLSRNLYYKNQLSLTPNENEYAEKEPQIEKDHRKFIGGLVSYVFQELVESKSTKVADQLIESLYNNQVGIDDTTKNNIKTNYSSVISQNSIELLEKLSTEQFAIPPSEKKSFRVSWESMTEEQLERALQLMTEKEDSSTSAPHLRKHLFSIYSKNKNLGKVLELKESMVANNEELNVGMKVQLIDVLIENEKLDEAMQVYDETCSSDENFVMNPSKTFKFAELLVRNGKIDKCMEVLKKRVEQVDLNDISEPTNTRQIGLAIKLLNTMVEHTDTEKVKEVVNLLLSAKFIPLQNAVFAPIIKTLMKKEDYNAVMQEFETIAEKYKLTPAKGSLLIHFIETDNGDMLQKVTDISTQIYGESNALFDVMIAFITCNRIREARKILETPGLRMNNDRLSTVCNMFVKLGKEESLRSLLKISSGIPSVDVNIIYSALLKLYENNGDMDQALGLWTEMQEEDVQPSDVFLNKLANILEENHKTVPFVKPIINTKKINRSDQTSNQIKLLEKGDINAVIKLVNSSDGAKLITTPIVCSKVLITLLEHDRYEDAKKLFVEKLRYIRNFSTRSIKFLIMKATQSGDIEFFTLLKKVENLPRREISFNNARAVAYAKAGHLEQLISSLEESFKNADTPDKLSEYVIEFPRSLILHLSDEYPEFSDRIFALAQKCIDAQPDNNNLPNILWMYHLNNKNYDQAEKIWSQYLANSNHLVFKFILTEMIKKKDAELGRKLLSYIERAEKIYNEKTYAYVSGKIIQTLVARDEIVEAMNVLKDGISKLGSINAYNISTFKNLRSACADKNIEFPYAIPNDTEKSQRDDSSDSE